MATAADRVSYRVCPLCEATCGLEIRTRGRGVVGIRGDADDPLSGDAVLNGIPVTVEPAPAA